MTTTLQDQVILVTGAGARGGMGEAIARACLERGATVICTDITGQEGRDVAKALGPKAHFHPLDVSLEADWQSAMTFAQSLGGLDGLVNNAAFYQVADLQTTTTESFIRAMMVNELGTFLGMKYASEHMRQKGCGAIVNISSTSGLKGSPRAIAYASTKWAVRGLTKTAAMDLARFKIRVNSIHPGATQTQAMLDTFSPEERSAREAKIPLGRSAQPKEIAEMAAYLLSPAAGFITGAEVAVDGGFSL